MFRCWSLECSQLLLHLIVVTNTFRLQHPSVTDRHQHRCSHFNNRDVFLILKRLLNAKKFSLTWLQAIFNPLLYGFILKGFRDRAKGLIGRITNRRRGKVLFYVIRYVFLCNTHMCSICIVYVASYTCM